MIRIFLVATVLVFCGMLPARSETVFVSTGSKMVAIDGRSDEIVGRADYNRFALLLGFAVTGQGSRLAVITKEMVRSDRVLSFDPVTLKQTGFVEIRGLVKAVVAPAAGTLVYAVSLHGISIVDLAIPKLVGVIPYAFGDTSAVITPDGKYLYLAELFGQDILVVDAASRTIVSTVTVGGLLGGIAMAPDGSAVYCTDYDDGTLSVLNTVTRQVDTRIPAGRGGVAVAIAPDGGHAYVAVLGHRWLDSEETWANSPAAVAIVDLKLGRMTGMIPVDGYPLPLALSTDGNKLYVGNDKAAVVTVIDTVNLVVLHKIALEGNGVDAIATTAGSFNKAD